MHFKHLYVRYQPANCNHEHLVMVGTPWTDPFGFNIDGEALEDIATELATAVQDCRAENWRKEERNMWQQHTADDIEGAYKSAISQIFTKTPEEFALEWAEQDQKQRAYKKWGGPPPKAILLPDNKILLTDDEGNPTVKEVDSSLADLLPDPREFGAKQDTSTPIPTWKVPKKKRPK